MTDIDNFWVYGSINHTSQTFIDFDDYMPDESGNYFLITLKNQVNVMCLKLKDLRLPFKIVFLNMGFTIFLVLVP